MAFRRWRRRQLGRRDADEIEHAYGEAAHQGEDHRVDDRDDDRRGMAAIDHLIRIVTMRKNGTSMSRMVTMFEPSAIGLPPSD